MLQNYNIFVANHMVITIGSVFQNTLHRKDKISYEI